MNCCTLKIEYNPQTVGKNQVTTQGLVNLNKELLGTFDDVVWFGIFEQLSFRTLHKFLAFLSTSVFDGSIFRNKKLE